MVIFIINENILLLIIWLKGSLCGAQFPKIVSGKSNNIGQNNLYLRIFIL
jgi:hypothetical protein